jgi:hypothetical protein
MTRWLGILWDFDNLQNSWEALRLYDDLKMLTGGVGKRPLYQRRRLLKEATYCQAIEIDSIVLWVEVSV